VSSKDDRGLEIFAELVIRSAIETLDDGEAATIAYAAVAGVVPVIDERKALRIYAVRFHGPPALSTVGLFATAPVVAALSRAVLRDTVFQTLQTARMRVPPERIPWAIDLIGADRAAQCPSLPKAARGG
jgi:predicted nucleic acid-binding protein